MRARKISSARFRVQGFNQTMRNPTKLNDPGQAAPQNKRHRLARMKTLSRSDFGHHLPKRVVNTSKACVCGASTLACARETL